MHGDPLIICLLEYLVSVNAENKKAKHDDIAGEILREVLDKIFYLRNNLQHRKGKTEEFSKKPVMNKQDKQ